MSALTLTTHDLERVYLWLTTPSRALPLKEGEVELCSFEPQPAQARVVTLSVEDEVTEAPTHITQRSAPSSLDTQSREGAKGSEAPEAQAEEEAQPEERSYLAYLEQVQARDEASVAQPAHTAQRRRRRKRSEPQSSAQSTQKTTQKTTQKHEQNPVQKRSRRRRPRN